MCPFSVVASLSPTRISRVVRSTSSKRPAARRATLRTVRSCSPGTRSRPFSSSSCSRPWICSFTSGRAEQQACLRALLPDVMTVGAALGGQVSARGLLGLGVDEVKLLLDQLALRAVAEPGDIHILCTSLVDDERHPLHEIGAHGQADLRTLALPDPQHATLDDRAGQVRGRLHALRHPVSTTFHPCLAGQQRHLVPAEMIDAHAERRIRHRDLLGLGLDVRTCPEQHRHASSLTSVTGPQRSTCSQLTPLSQPAADQ
jgi:hypothetical protein